MTKRILLFVFALVFMLTGRLFAETIYLKTGTSMVGKILKYEKDYVIVESVKDHGVHRISKKDVFLINFDSSSEVEYKDHKKEIGSNTVYLKNGEIIYGKITQYNSDFLTLESLKGQGVLQIPSEDINMITTRDTLVDMSMRTGIGYVSHKSTLSGQGGPAAYQSDMLSYREYLDKDLFMDLLFAFGNARYDDNTLNVMSLDVRGGLIFQKYRNLQLYYGGAFGWMTITDDANSINGSGFSYGAFTGGEIFFTSMPNLGFSAEIGISKRQIGDYEAFDVSTSTFPTLSAHYYF